MNRCYIAAAAFCLALSSAASCDNFMVTNTDNDPVAAFNGADTGSLAYAIIHAQNGDTITLQPGLGSILLILPLPVIATGVTINGNGNTIDGNGENRSFFVDAASQSVSINNLVIQNGLAQGGAGGTGASGGGGGLGAGGAIFINQGNVTLTNVTFRNNSAAGGAGGVGIVAGASGGVGGVGGGGGGGGGGLGGAGGSNNGGGGGFSGNGGNGSPDDGGAGGGGGIGIAGLSFYKGPLGSNLSGNGGNASALGSAGGGGIGAGTVAQGGFGGGAEGNIDTRSTLGGGGGGSPNSPGSANMVGLGGDYGGGGGGIHYGGDGGRFGGGGGSPVSGGGQGGFGGGGGGVDLNTEFGGAAGNGGFGGGGGSGVTTSGLGGAFAGSGSGVIGGDGATLGGAVFVAPGASLTLTDTSVPTVGAFQGTAHGGSGDPTGGQAAGSAFFLAGDTTISVSTGKSQTIAGSIVDISAETGYQNDPTAAGFSPAKLTKTGGGVLVLAAGNSYGGGTEIDGGALWVPSDESLGISPMPVTISNGASLLFTASSFTGRSFTLNHAVPPARTTLQTSPGATLTLATSTVSGGILDGSFIATTGAQFSGNAATTASLIAMQNNTSLASFTNGGTLNVSGNVAWNGGTNSGAVNVAGASTLTATGLVNTGSMNVAGKITIPLGSTLELNGGSLANDGTITGVTDVNAGALTQGTGSYGPVNINGGGIFHPGNSPGSAITGNTLWGPGGELQFDIDNATGTMGLNWSHLTVNGTLIIGSNSAASSQVILAIDSLDAADLPGAAQNFNPAQNYSWEIASATAGIGGLSPQFSIDTSRFSNPTNGGSFSLSQSSGSLFLQFTAAPVPEPGALAILAIGGMPLLLRRRK